MTPTLGQIMLASDDAETIKHALTLAEICARRQSYFDADQYNRQVRAAQTKLTDLARRLGFDVVPSREPVDA